MWAVHLFFGRRPGIELSASLYLLDAACSEARHCWTPAAAHIKLFGEDGWWTGFADLFESLLGPALSLREDC
jgi:hypothetical protein